VCCRLAFQVAARCRSTVHHRLSGLNWPSRGKPRPTSTPINLVASSVCFWSTAQSQNPSFHISHRFFHSVHCIRRKSRSLRHGVTFAQCTNQESDIWSARRSCYLRPHLKLDCTLVQQAKERTVCLHRPLQDAATRPRYPSFYSNRGGLDSDPKRQALPFTYTTTASPSSAGRVVYKHPSHKSYHSLHDHVFPGASSPAACAWRT
jgi:hypothetical protein